MVKNVEHIGIAVANVDKANELFEALLGQAPYKEEEVETEGVHTSFFIENHTKIELLAATNGRARSQNLWNGKERVCIILLLPWMIFMQKWSACKRLVLSFLVMNLKKVPTIS